jgi:hypothetical protein
MDELTALQASVLSLAKQYVVRQSLVLEAELRPDIIMRVENRAIQKFGWSRGLSIPGNRSLVLGEGNRSGDIFFTVRAAD